MSNSKWLSRFCYALVVGWILLAILYVANGFYTGRIINFVVAGIDVLAAVVYYGLGKRFNSI